MAEAFTTELSKKNNPTSFAENRTVAKAGGKVAKQTRDNMEVQLGRSIVSRNNAKGLQNPEEQKGIE